MSPDERRRRRHHAKPYIWLFLVGIIFTVALFAVGNAARQSGDDNATSRAELARVVSVVTLARCTVENQVSAKVDAAADVLKSALKTERKLLDSERDNRQITAAQFAFAARSLDEHLAVLDGPTPPQDCAAQVATIKKAAATD